MTTNHTPTPFAANVENDNVVIRDREASCVATVTRMIGTIGGKEQQEVATFIVRACNSHDALVAALERVQEALADKDHPTIVHQLGGVVRAALAAAKVQS